MTPSISIIASLFAVSSCLSAATVSDGGFSNWSFGGIGNGSMTFEAANGNPGSRVNVTTFTTIGVFAYGTGIYEGTSTTENLAGAFTLSLDVLSGPGDFGAGQSIALLVRQGSDIYGQFLNNTGFPQSNFTTLGFGGTFDPLLFTRWVGTGDARPDLSGGTETFFGFSAYNSSNNTTVTKYYDNFSLNYTPVPEPGGPLLLGVGVVGLLGSRRRSAIGSRG